MKYTYYLYVLLCAALLTACQDSEESTFTARELSYAMVAASADYDIQGTATFREQTDGSLQLTLQLENTVSGGQHPGHLHYGTTDVPDSDIALLLSPIDGASGTSTTTFSQLADGTAFGFEQLASFDGSLKVHLDDGPNRNVVLAGANVGLHSGTIPADIAVCSSSDQ